MKLNRKGFMLAEVVVVASVIAVALVTLYIGLNSVTSAYETRNRYYDIDAMFAAMEVNDYLIRTDLINSHLGQSGNLLDLIENKSREESIDYDDSLLMLYQTYYNKGIKTYYIDFDVNASLDTESLLRQRIEEFQSIYGDSNTFNEYLDYLKNNIDYSKKYNYLIIVELKNKTDENDCYYYTLKVGDSNA